MRIITFLILSALLLLSTGLHAEKDRPFVDEASTDRKDVEDPEPWKETKTDLPPYPDDDDLLEFDVDRPDSPFRYYVDGENLRIGVDGVVRYTLVIKSRSGAANVSYEGVRCNERRFKVYAYGSRGQFKPLKAPQWEKLKQTGYDRYRLDLRNFYLCRPSEYRPNSMEEILHLLSEGFAPVEDNDAFL